MKLFVVFLAVVLAFGYVVSPAMACDGGGCDTGGDDDGGGNDGGGGCDDGGCDTGGCCGDSDSGGK